VILIPNVPEQTVSGQHYDLDRIWLCLSCLLVGKVPLQAVPRLLPIFDTFYPLNTAAPVPNWTTSRMWLMRLGLFQLRQRLPKADDWVWFLDHSVQIGQQRCLAVLGGRLSELPTGPLQRSDLQLLHLKVMHASNMHSNYQELRHVLARTGPPRAVVSDHGADLLGALRLLRQDLGAANVLDVYDIKHRAALALKERLESQPRWAEFLSAVGRARNATKQTEWAFLLPPVLRTKSRYLNLGELVRWSERTCWLLEHQPAALLEHGTVERLQEKLGWLLDFRQEVACWRGWYQVAARAEQAVRNRGLYCGAARDVRVRLEPVANDAGGRQMASELVAFVGEQCQGVRAGECVPGSTEVLESCFGTLKALEKDQSRSGFTGLVLGLGALLGKVTKEVVRLALNSTPIKAVRRWYQENIGESLQSKRGKLYRLANVTDLG
jgi:hypothetical protein